MSADLGGRAVRFKLDHAGVGEVLKSPWIHGEIDGLAGRIAANTRTIVAQVAPGIEVDVEPYTTDRGAAAVVIADPRGIELQASHGALTKAAGQVGLEVHAK